MLEKLMSQRRIFKQNAKVVFNTKSGKEVIAILKDEYVNTSCLDETPEKTYYRLGQKELIQTLLAYVNDEHEIDDLIHRIQLERVNENYE